MFRAIIAVATAFALSLVSLAACGGGARVLTKEETAERDRPAEAAPAEFPDYYGEHVAAGVDFALDSAGRAVDGVGVIVYLEKVQTMGWSKGEEGSSSGTAYIRMERGGESARLLVAPGETKTALGARVAVSEAIVAYDEERMDYVPKVTARVTRAD